MSTSKSGPLEVSFEAPLLKSGERGGWTYVIWPQSVEFFGTKGLVRVRGYMDSQPFQSAFMALGNGSHKLPVRGQLAKRLGKTTGDAIRVRLTERIS